MIICMQSAPTDWRSIGVVWQPLSISSTSIATLFWIVWTIMNNNTLVWHINMAPFLRKLMRKAYIIIH